MRQEQCRLYRKYVYPHGSACIDIVTSELTGRPSPVPALKEQNIPYYGVKEAVFPFNMFPEVDPLLGPEMRSTGEVLGLSKSFGEAFYKGFRES
mgnify:CR=1 FL=1